MNKQEKIREEVEDLLQKLGFEVNLEVKKSNDVFEIQIKTEEEAALLIGGHGDTLSSLQKVLEALFFKLFEEKTNILVDVNDYRKRQKERLENIAENVAKRVLTEKTSAALRQFSPYERKIIHEYIGENHPTLSTHSEGEGYERKLIVQAKKEQAAKDK